jgi:hypothetical protein
MHIYIGSHNTRLTYLEYVPSAYALAYFEYVKIYAALAYVYHIFYLLWAYIM